jgi:hypothetical protein
LIESLNAIIHEDFLTAVKKTVELPFSSRLTDVCAQSGPCEIERIDEDETEATSDTA